MTTITSWGPRNLTYKQYIQATVEERILTAAQDELWQYSSDILATKLNRLGDDIDPDSPKGEKLIAKMSDTIEKDLTRELIRQLQDSLKRDK